jgi:hypothetical protein
VLNANYIDTHILDELKATGFTAAMQRKSNIR